MMPGLADEELVCCKLSLVRTCIRAEEICAAQTHTDWLSLVAQ